MDPTDYIADLEEEMETLRGRVADLEEELDKAREELRLARERKVEEVSVLSYFTQRARRFYWIQLYSLMTVCRRKKTVIRAVQRKKRPPPLVLIPEQLSMKSNVRLSTGLNPKNQSVTHLHQLARGSC